MAPVRRLPSAVLFLVLLLGCDVPALGQDRAARFDSRSRTRGLAVAWGQAWRGGVPGYGKTASDVAFAAFHPQMGWFVTDRIELYGEGSLLVYHAPEAAAAAGLVGMAGRYHLWNHRRWTPYLTGGVGVLWTSLEVPELDRVFNFQVVLGAGVRLIRRSGPGLILELRNHHTSNAGTAGRNLGLNALAILVGAQWILR